MIPDAATFVAWVAQANLSPSVHNTQPTHWRLQPDGRVRWCRKFGQVDKLSPL
jgi:hypothetical protein